MLSCVAGDVMLRSSALGFLCRAIHNHYNVFYHRSAVIVGLCAC